MSGWTLEMLGAPIVQHPGDVRHVLAGNGDEIVCETGTFDVWSPGAKHLLHTGLTLDQAKALLGQ